jgi:glycosyltransferase involved in cell wall biosynthesis
MKICVLVPAYNCASTIEEVCKRVPKVGASEVEIIVLDDHSCDNTFEIASKLPGVFAYRNPVNLGYGGASHRLYEIALERGVDLAINIHGDLGHDPEEIKRIIEELSLNHADIAVGSRLLFLLGNLYKLGWIKMIMSDKARGGMPIVRFIGHVVLTKIQNLIYRTNLHSFHEGMRACRRPVIEWEVKANFPKNYAYDNEFVYQAYRNGFGFCEVPVTPSYDPRAKTSSPPIRYGFLVIRQIIRVAITGK